MLDFGGFSGSVSGWDGFLDIFFFFFFLTYPRLVPEKGPR